MNGSIIILFLNFIFFAAVAALNFAVTGNGKFPTWAKDKARTLRIAFAVGFLILFVLDISGAVKLGGYRFISVWGLGFSAVSAAFGVRVSEKMKFIFDFLLRSFSICVIIEIFIFNINSAHITGNRYTKKELPITEAVEVIGNQGSGTVFSGESVISFKELDMPVGTITVSAESSRKRGIDFKIDATDDTNSGDYRYDIALIQTINNNERSNTAPVNFSGNVHDLKIRFYPVDGETITINSIMVNSPIKFHFSVIRFMLMLLGSLAVFALSSPRIFRVPYRERRKAVKCCIWGFTAILVCGTLFIVNMARYCSEDHSILKDLKTMSGNQISQEIVDAFEKGQVYLWEASDEIMAVENPYDWSQRGGAAYPWDHLLYDGKIYSYYGIGPVIALFLPYHKLTGYYFPSSWACFLFAAFGIIFLTKLWIYLCDNFFKNTDSSLLLVGLSFLQLSTGIGLCLFTSNFYEIAQASGFLCVTGGAYFLLSSNIIGDGKLRIARLAISGIFLSMGVLCRPTLAVYCLAAMIFVYAGYRKIKKADGGKDKKSKIRKYLPYSLCAFLPYVVIGAVQMWYNYARFGNPIDFGIQYSLTINDFTASEYHTHFAAIGFFNFLFTMPVFGERFPFFFLEFPFTFNPQGYYFIATGSALGLIWRAAPIAGYIRSGKAYRIAENKDKKLYAVIIAAVCIVCPFIIIYSIWESGYGSRYCVDFAWQIILGALIVCYIIYNNASESVRKHLNTLIIAAAFFGAYMNFVQTTNYIAPVTAFNAEWSERYREFSRLFEFWI